MRVILFYDLPTVTAVQRSIHARFRRRLVRSGFIMMQESVYCRLAINQNYVSAIIREVDGFKPEQGLIQIITVTENQYAKMVYLIGEKTSRVIDTPERIVII